MVMTIAIVTLFAAQVAFSAPALSEALEMIQAPGSGYMSGGSGSDYKSGFASGSKPAPKPNPPKKPAAPKNGDTVVTTTSAFTMKLTITEADFKTKKKSIIADMAKALKVKAENIKAEVVKKLAEAVENPEDAMQNPEDATTVDTVLAETRVNAGDLQIKFTVTTVSSNADAKKAAAEAKKVADGIKAAVKKITDGKTKLGDVTVPKQTVTVTSKTATKVVKPTKSGVNRQASAGGVFVIAVLSSLYLCKA